MTELNADVSQAFLGGLAGTYPESEAVATAELSPGSFPAILDGIKKERAQIHAEVARISREVAPDIDDWIRQAKQLEQDIERSKTTAREIVRQAEEAKVLRLHRNDIAQKTQLLLAEVSFNTKLEKGLEDIRTAVRILADGQNAATQGDLESALRQLRAVEAIVTQLGSLDSTRAVEILHHRVERLQAILVEEVERQWNALLHVDRANSRVIINSNSPDAAPIAQMETVVGLSSQLSLLDGNIKRSCRDISSIILKPRLEPGPDDLVADIEIGNHEIHASGRKSKGNALAALDDIASIVQFLDSHLPKSASIPLSRSLMPLIISRLNSHWLMPAVPTSLDEIPGFQLLLQHVQKVAADLARIGWSGGTELNEWVEAGPRIWLGKRRESALTTVRVLLSERLQDTKVVERTETQMVSRQDLIAGSTNATDDWGSAWDDADDQKSPTKMSGEEDDFSAWGAEEAAETSVVESNVGEAWGWDDQNTTSAPSSPVKDRKLRPKTNGQLPHADSAEREVTLKETYTITAIPDEVYEMIVQVTRDAEELLQPQFQDSPVASAALTLYTLPTLILAGFRALAPSYYAPVVGGNMYLYNDSMRLSTELDAFAMQQVRQDAASSLPKSAWPSTRMKLDAEITMLESFSKRAYGKEMESQRTILRDLLDGAQGFANCAEIPFAAECDSAIDMIVDRIRDVSKQWNGILSHSALLQSVGSLLSTVTNKMTVDMTDLSDISEDESKRLRHFCNEITTLSDIFTQEKSSGEVSDMTGVYSPGWFKFQYLSEVMESSLADIKYLWAEGGLKSQFEAAEVIDLVEALFAESDYRRRAITEIRRS